MMSRGITLINTSKIYVQIWLVAGLWPPSTTLVVWEKVPLGQQEKCHRVFVWHFWKRVKRGPAMEASLLGFPETFNEQACQTHALDTSHTCRAAPLLHMKLTLLCVDIYTKHFRRTALWGTLGASGSFLRPTALPKPSRTLIKPSGSSYTLL